MKKYASYSFFVAELGFMKGKKQQSVVQNSNWEESKLPCRKKQVISCRNVTDLLMAKCHAPFVIAGLYEVKIGCKKS